MRARDDRDMSARCFRDASMRAASAGSTRTNTPTVLRSPSDTVTSQRCVAYHQDSGLATSRL
jgi:hypothetical protein